MVIIYFLFAFLVIILLYDFKKGVLLYAPWKLFFNLNVRFGPFTFDVLMTLFILLLFLFKRDSFHIEKFPLKRAFFIYGIVYSIGCLFPEFAPNFIPRIIISVISFSFVYYFCLADKSDIRFAIVSFVVFASIMCLNGLLQPIYGINPLDDYLQSISDNEKGMFLDNSLVRMGQVRYRSFIPHPISYGVACCIILYLIIWSIHLQKERLQRIYCVIAIVLLLSGIIICGSRTPILGLLPLGYWYIRKITVINSSTLVSISLIVVFIVLYGDYLFYSLESIFSSELSNDAGGSSTDMRIRQYMVAWKVLQISPIWGMGMNFDSYKFSADIAGGESVWLPLIMNNGIVGVIVYAVLYYYIIRLNLKSKGKGYLIIVTMAWLIMRTATSLIGVSDAQFFCVYFCIYRYYELQSFNNHTRLQRRAVYNLLFRKRKIFHR